MLGEKLDWEVAYFLWIF